MTATLDGSEGGCWIVKTEGSTTHRFDLDELTVTRIPGPRSVATINDRTRPLLEIIQCAVGERGYWLMRADASEADLFKSYWHLSSRIVSINPATSDCAER